MGRRFETLFLVVLAGCVLLAGRVEADWLQFRGSASNGVATPDMSSADAPPISWNDGENIAWKSPLPGRGQSSPIVVGTRVVVTAVSGFRQDRLHVLCFDRGSGKQLWERQLWATGMTYCHPKGSMAAPTPVSDGKRIFALFSCNDLVCYDLDGTPRWLRALTLDYPNAANSVGLSSCPIIANDTVVLQIENDAVSFAVGLNTTDGTNRWKIDRPRAVNWASPVRLDGKSVLFQSPSGLTALDARTGNSLWTHEVKCGVIASPTVANNMIFLPADGMTAFKWAGSSEKAPTPAWNSGKVKLVTPSPLVYDDRVYALGGSILRAIDIETGDIQWRLRLKGAFSSSPVAAGGRIYCFNEDGLGYVVQPGAKEGKVIATSEMGEGILCTPAISGGELFVRSDGQLWKIAKAAE